jgi:GTP cyclohydrolase II
VAAHMLASLNVGSVRLLTNNPQKVRQLAELGVTVSARVPLVIPPNEHNRFYLATKAVRSGHFMDVDGKPHLPEQDEPVIVGEGGAVL